MAQSQSQSIRTFVLGNKELEGKKAEFQYDHGWYSIFDIMDEERSIVYKSKNAQEAYLKWNIYIGRKKERPQRSFNTEEQHTQRNTRQGSGRKEYADREEAGRNRSREKYESRGEHQHSRQNQRRHNKNRQNRA